MSSFYKKFIVFLCFLMFLLILSSCDYEFKTKTKNDIPLTSTQNLKVGVVSGFNINSDNQDVIINFKNLLTEYKKNKVDTLIFCGNMISGTSLDDYFVLQNSITDIYGKNIPKILYTMGKNEWLIKSDLSENDAKAKFLEFNNFKDINFYTEVNNTGFLCISGDDITGNISTELNENIELWLSNKANSNSPLFVIYNSEFNENELNKYYKQNSDIYNLLSCYENVVLIDGNNKYSVYNERAVIQNEFTTVYCGIADNKKVIDEVDNFYAENEIINASNYNSIYYGLLLEVKDTKTEVTRILTDKSKLSNIWNINTEKENFRYSTDNYFNGEKNKIDFQGNINCYNSIQNDLVALSIDFSVTSSIIAECYKIYILSDSYEKSYYILNENYNLSYSFSKTFVGFPLGDYKVYLYAIDFYGTDSEKYIFNEAITTDILPIPEDDIATEDNDLINDLSYNSEKITISYTTDNVSKNSLKSLKIIGEADNNNYPYIILKPTEEFYNIKGKIINFDCYFINAKCSIAIYLNNEISLNCTLSNNKDYNCWLNSSLDFNDFFDDNTLEEITEIKVVFCFDIAICNEGTSIIYLDNIYLQDK